MGNTLVNENTLVDLPSFVDKDFHGINNEYAQILQNRVTIFTNIGYNNEVRNPLEIFNLEFPKALSRKKLFSYSISLQKWIGHIIEIGETDFMAKVYEINNPSDTYEITSFDKSDISTEDIDLLKIGAVFYWTIGYSFDYGQKRKESIIRFRRQRDWTEEDFNLAVDRVDDLMLNLIIS